MASKVVPNSHFGETDPYDRSGMWVGNGENGLEVMDVVKGGPSDQAGIKVGDGILAIDGKMTSNLRIEEVRRWLKAEDNTEVLFRIRSGKTERNTPVRLRNLI